MTVNSDAAVHGDDPARVAIVSGGSRGLGRAVVERLLRDGWRVSTFSRTENEFIEQTMRSHGTTFTWTAADLADPEQMSALVREVYRRYGRLDLLVNNAAQLHQHLFLTTPRADIARYVTANLTAPIQLTLACARVMARHRTGCIVNVSSVNAIRGHTGVSLYSAAKAGLDGLSRSLARELGPFGIRVNTVVPGFFDSDMTGHMTPDQRRTVVRRTPLERIADATEVAGVVAFLASPDARFMTGQSVVVDGGLSC